MSPNCPSIDSLRAFADGTLNHSDFEQIACHLHQCTDCEHRIDALPKNHDALLTELAGLSHDEIDSATGSMSRSTDSLVQIERLLGSTTGRPDVTLDYGNHFSRLLSQGPCPLGRFELRDEIGCGSFGHVFRAYDSELDRMVAIKIQRAGSIASEAQRRQFLREARSVARLKHPSIVALFETGETDDGVCFLVTEYVDGETLEHRLAESRPDYRQSAELILRLTTAVDYAHQEGVVHRDLKPTNILIDRSGALHLTDFGLAKRENLEGSLTTDGRVVGTPAYMPPEHARGCSEQSDARSDIYSLGVILYEMLTGERPFQGTQRLLLLQVLDEEPRPLRQLDDQIPKDLETICLTAMAKQPARRYQTGAALIADLQRFLQGEPIEARPIGYTEKLWRWSTKYPFAAALLVAIVVSSVVGFAYLRSLNAWIVREMALENTRLYSDMLEEFNEYYSEIRSEYFHDQDNPDLNPPLPATMRIEVAERISSHSQDGMQARVFSPHSFRKELRPRDHFERETLEVFNDRIAEKSFEVNDPFEHFQFVEIGNQPVLKYARGQRMSESCIHCHNTHQDSPKTDWEVGDLAGVFSLTRPMSVDIERAQEGFRGATLLVIAVSLALAACLTAIVYRTRQRRDGW